MSAKNNEKNNEKMLRYQSMQDHDILVAMGVKIEYIEESLTTMNGAIKRQAKVVGVHETRITAMETTCVERSKTVFNRLDVADSRYSGNFRISKKLIGAAVGAVGAIVTVVYIIGKLFRWWS